MIRASPVSSVQSKASARATYAASYALRLSRNSHILSNMGNVRLAPLSPGKIEVLNDPTRSGLALLPCRAPGSFERQPPRMRRDELMYGIRPP
jgi:hypothetical protein